MTRQFNSNSEFNRDMPIDEASETKRNDTFITIGFLLKWGAVFFFLIVSVIIGIIVSKSTSQLPDIKILETYRPNESTQIFDRTGTLIANIHGDEDRVVVPLKQISPNMQRAVLAIEDNRFYEHNGVDPRGTIRAFVTNISADDSVQGGSTITQQLVKNLFLSPEKSYSRKLAEAILALRVEKHYTKDKILEMYLNQVYFGNLSYGIEKAARRYFKKPAKRLTLAESALLAGLLKAPEGLSPYYYPEAARKRQLEVLDKMVEYGYITEKQRKAAAQDQIVLNSREARPSKHPYFVTYVIQELEQQYGEDVVRRGGLRVFTTLDPAAQESAEKALYKAITEAPKYSNVAQGAMVAMDVETGEILALVGGIDFKKNQFNAATQARRAVGSTFKPFVYLTGFRLGKYSPKSPISDKPVRYGNWAPHNWDGRFMGAMDIRKALTLSRNTPTVQVGMDVGIDEIIKTAHAAGITSEIDRNSSSLLGSSGVSPLELVTGYATMARGGVYIQPTAIKRVEDGRGKVVKIDTPAPKRVFDQDYVAGIVDILIDVVQKGTGKSAQLEGRIVAGKTGTTDQMRDIWFMGFTPDLVAGVWMGNPKYIPMHGVFSSNAARAWHEFAEGYYKAHDIPPQSFFTASNEYAARAGLVHLVDKDGVNEAKRKLAVENLSRETAAAAAGRTNSSGNKQHASTSSTDRKNKPNASSSSPTVATSTPKRQQNTNSNASFNSALHETREEKQEKYKNWEQTLEKVRENLEN